MIRYFKLATPIELSGVTIEQIGVYTTAWTNYILGNGLLLARGLGYSQDFIKTHSYHKGFEIRLEGDTVSVNGQQAKMVKVLADDTPKLNFEWLLGKAKLHHSLINVKAEYGLEMDDGWLTMAEDLYDIEKLPDGGYNASSPFCRNCSTKYFERHPITQAV